MNIFNELDSNVTNIFKNSFINTSFPLKYSRISPVGGNEEKLVRILSASN